MARVDKTWLPTMTGVHIPAVQSRKTEYLIQRNDLLPVNSAGYANVAISRGHGDDGGLWKNH